VYLKYPVFFIKENNNQIYGDFKIFANVVVLYAFCKGFMVKAIECR